jgi:signal transduction histidine kinase
MKMQPERQRLIRSLFDEYIEMYASRDERLTAKFSQNFSGYAGSSDQLVVSTEEWIKVTRLDFEQVPERIDIELLDLSLQDLSEDVVAVTAFFHIHLPIPESILAQETARLVLVFRLEGGNWMIAHSGISIPFGQAEGGEIYPMRSLRERNLKLEALVADRTHALQAANDELAQSQGQLLQSEKMAAIGQLAAGIAHEINNPIGFVKSNLGTLKEYVEQLFALLDAYESAATTSSTDASAALQAAREKADIDFLRNDVVALLGESRDGLERVRKIVQDLRDFSRIDNPDWQAADLNGGLESTLNVVWNELKYKAEVVKSYGELPPVRCHLGQINQVFMNLLVNAAQAIEDRGTITLSSGADGPWAWVSVEDTGKGMTSDVMKRIFEPFFTTKPVGKGTGLGLSLAYDMVKKHGGRIDVSSQPGQGTCFKIWLPIAGPENSLPC